MVEAAYHFPTGFMWGTATAAHQVEGGNKNNNWAAWEQEPGRIHQGQHSGLACDWWGGRWQEDFDRAAESGQNAHRLSIEWSRIQPAPGIWDEDALDHYRQMVRGLRERGMTPMVTLHHFTDPLWISEQGGWERDISQEFAIFAEKVVGALKEYVHLWCTINEPNVYTASGYVLGVFPPGKNSLPTAFKVMENMVRGHAAAYQAVHRAQPQAQVGLAMHYRRFVPYRPGSPLDRWAARTMSRTLNEFFTDAAATGVLRFPFYTKKLAAARGTQDFIGINYYTEENTAFSLLRPGELFTRRFYDPEAPLSTTGFIAHKPEGFYPTLKWATQYKLPVYITENGVEDPDDRLRPRYLAEHIHQLWRAVNFNWPIKGYFHWSLVDNFEWERGWSQRFGLWALDETTQARRMRPSAAFYAEICRQNGISSDMVNRYAPQSLPVLFPGWEE